MILSTSILNSTLQNVIIIQKKGGDSMAEQPEKKRGKGTKTSGRKYNQKMKPFLVYQYLMQCTDNEHFETGDAIAVDEKNISFYRF